MSFPLVDLSSPTRLVFEWGWLLVTRGNFVAYALVAIVFILGATVRLPGARANLRQVEAQNMGPAENES